ncbi:MAG: Uncharacterized protein G01um10147_355 [Microgenomates group bacterium Gr01-1014_7]|nr:MAG: Uncharacterized protein G01um10147_355 [Microgenomates group bacterium Gr01-1014_7]
MDIKQKFVEAFKRIWYIQGFNAYPLFLNRAGISGFEMEKVLGYGYSIILNSYRNGYCEMHYLSADLKRIWERVKENLKKDSKYVEKIASKYFKIFEKHEKLFKQMDKLNLSKLEEPELIQLLKNCSQASIDAVGVAHIVDPIGIGSEVEFKQKLLSEIKNKDKFNEYFSILTTPLKLSFLGREEEDLRKIGNLTGIKRKKALKLHLKKYSWVNNSYAGPTEITLTSLSRRLNLLNKEKVKPKLLKTELINELSLSKEIKDLIAVIDFSTIWQDRRKKNVLISISYFSKVLEEVSKRISIPSKLLYFFGIEDFNSINSFKDIKKFKGELEERTKGVFFLLDQGQEFEVCGQDYQTLYKIYSEVEKGQSRPVEDIHGSVANRGTALGKVVICKDLESIQKVETGNVIVASMTRPEFMPALKKASAIVTDEGGVTCHAAILSRELGIPAIIGTKIATRILRDGMKVEVRANHGIVRIIS